MHVRLLDRALFHPRARARFQRRHACWRAEHAGAVLLQPLDVVEADEAQPAARRIVARIATLARRDGAVRIDRDAVVGRLELDRPAVADHAVAGVGHELALGIDLESAVARVALAAWSLHHEEGIAIDGGVERVAGRPDRTGAEIAPGGAVLHVAHTPVGALEAGSLRLRHQVFFKDRTIGLVAGGVHIGDVVGHDIELTLERDLSRQSDQESVLHRQAPHVRARGPGAAAPTPHSHGVPSSGDPGSPKRRLTDSSAGPVPGEKPLLFRYLSELSRTLGRQIQPPATIHPAKLSGLPSLGKISLTIGTLGYRQG